MSTTPSILSFIWHADMVVKCVIVLLICASIVSWTFIIQRLFLFRHSQTSAQQFEEAFWSGADLTELNQQYLKNKANASGLAKIFHAGYHEYQRLTQVTHPAQPAAVIEGVQRAMRIAENREAVTLEKHLGFLATVGSTSPYVGLFGTVWGIMASFRSLGTLQQATLAAVAPGISEALIATAIGLFAAIPAFIAYNRYSNQSDCLLQQYANFQEAFINLIHRQLYAS